MYQELGDFFHFYQVNKIHIFKLEKYTFHFLKLEKYTYSIFRVNTLHLIYNPHLIPI